MLDFIELGLDIKHKIKIYTVKQKKRNQFSFVCIFFTT